MAIDVIVDVGGAIARKAVGPNDASSKSRRFVSSGIR